MNVLIVKLSSIGDVIHTLPAVGYLRRALPDATIRWVVDQRAAAILENLEVVDEVIRIDPRHWRRGFPGRESIAAIRSFVGSLSAAGDSNGGADVAIDFQGLLKSGLVTWLSRAPRRIGFADADLRERASKVFLTEQVSTTALRHVIDKNLALAHAAVGDPLTTGTRERAEAAYEFPIHLADSDLGYADQLLKPVGDRFAIINPGGGWPTKLWAPDRYAAVASWLYRKHQLPSIVTFGPGEESLVSAVHAAAISGATVPAASSLKQFAALARRAKLFVGGDTGPMHLAAACGTPIVAIYGPTAAERNGPFDAADVVVGRDLWCRTDCHRRRCWHWECMDVEVEAVEQAIDTRLGRIHAGAGPYQSKNQVG